jgi:hypothetical protein
MKIINKLQEVSKVGNNHLLVKLYLLDCCKKLIRFRSSGCLSKNLKVGRGFLRGYKTKKQIHKAEWELEGEAFAVEYYSTKRVAKN